MREIQLKYGCNPHQGDARIFMEDGGALPLRVLNGNPGYINFMDALNAWQLVKELREALGRPAAASFKHLSPASAALGLPLSPALKRACFVEDVEGLEDSPLACAYARARGTDRMSSFGDWAALSDICDGTTALLLKREVSDGVIAPGYTKEALAILQEKRRGNYNVVEIDPAYSPAPIERRQLFGICFEQARNDARFAESSLENVVTRQKSIPPEAKRDLLVALITLKYTQSNSVCYALEGQAVGVGAGQQSRIHCTRLAGDKADLFRLRMHPRTLELPFLEGLSRPERDNAVENYLSGASGLWEGENWRRCFSRRPTPIPAAEREAFLREGPGLSLGSDAFFPFGDSIERACRSGVRYVAQPGGSVRDAEVIESCDTLGVAMAFTGIRLFHH